MQDKAEVAEEARIGIEGRGVEVGVRSLKGVRRDLTMLAAQVTDLASLGGLAIAGRVILAHVRVDVRVGGGTVAISWDRGVVKVVGCDGLEKGHGDASNQLGTY